MVNISKGNKKLGKNVANVSLVPCATCPADAPCRSKCYAMKAFRQYPNVRKAWGENTESVKQNDIQYFEDICQYVEKKRPEYFRWHVAGDILNQDYLEGMKIVAKNNPGTRFLAFTKMHNLDFTNLPANLQVVISLWPNWGENKTNLPVAFMQDGTENRVNGQEIQCPGSCANCKACWHLGELQKNVVFNAH
jgi:hypothetical protein